ncbi:MAG: glycosyltransferase [Nanoarchaeota archaeon]|nr:glycosyltransferase [Nanoarchaeota archaeon]
MIKASVIIPCLNEEKLIEWTLRSVIDQSIPRRDYEIIVSDGKSTDNTVNIARKYADKVISKKNNSISEARNLGAAIAKGKYLVFIDSDTIVSRTLLESVIKKFKDKRVSGAFVNYGYKSNSIVINFLNVLFSILNNLINIFFPKFVLAGGVCMIARKTSFNKIKGFDENMKTSEDNDLAHRLHNVGNFVLINETAYTSDRRLKKMGVIGLLKYYLTDFYKHHFTKNFSGEYIHHSKL